MNWSDTTKDRWTGRLSEYLDGELPETERDELESHLFQCAACARTLDELRAVVARACALRDRASAEDLWPAIRERIRAADADAQVVALRPRPMRGRRFSLSVPELAAAALALMIVSAAAVWLARSAGRAPAVASRPAATAPAAGAAVLGQLDVRMANFADVQYDAAVADLQRALQEGRGRLSPATLQVLEENLRIIDGAIEQARQALASDPGNIYLNDHLAETMRRKLDLLRRANAIAGAQT